MEGPKSKQRLTLDDLRKMAEDTNVITPAVAGRYMGCDPYTVTCAVRDNPERVHFPFFWAGSHLKIILEGFIRWAEGREQDPDPDPMKERR